MCWIAGARARAHEREDDKRFRGYLGLDSRSANLSSLPCCKFPPRRRDVLACGRSCLVMLLVPVPFFCALASLVDPALVNYCAPSKHVPPSASPPSSALAMPPSLLCCICTRHPPPQILTSNAWAWPRACLAPFRTMLPSNLSGCCRELSVVFPARQSCPH